MSKIALTPNASGTGTLTLAAPNTNTDRTLTLPDATTTLVGTDATQTLSNKSIAASQLTGSIVSAQMGSSGSAPVYACRAWMNYDGIGLSMRGSGNIASVTNPATGRYVVTFTTAMPDANYSVVLGGSVSDNASNPWQDFGSIARAFTTTGFIIDCAAQGTTAAGQANWAIITAAVFR